MIDGSRIDFANRHIEQQSYEIYAFGEFSITWIYRENKNAKYISCFLLVKG